MKKCIKEKYKIAYIMHKGSTMGGFPQHTEMSIKGLKDLGHEVDFFYLDYCSDDKMNMYKKKMAEYKQGTFTKSGVSITLTKGKGTGYYYEPESGWIMPVTPFKTLENKKKLRAKLETYDAVFWHTPFWFKQQPIMDDKDWTMLLDLENPVNIAFIHDANIRENGAWQYHISKYFDAIINVHPASYNSCSVLKTPRTLIFNPQDMSNVDINYSAWKNVNETKVLFSLQNWKSSKHVDDLIRATNHIRKDATILAVGDGIEARYMFGSVEKMKPQHFCRLKDDPNIPKELIGLTIGAAAKLHPGFSKMFWLSEDERDMIFGQTAFFIDTAYYKINRTLGSHFSRTLVECMMNGVVPIARNLGLSGNDEGMGEVFNAWENYLMIPYDATPKEFADMVNSFFELDKKPYNEIVQNNYELLEHFDVINVCKQYVDVIRGKKTGWFKEWGVGTPTQKFLDKADSQWYGVGDKKTFNFKKEDDDDNE